jgi:hypothetical protein
VEIIVEGELANKLKKAKKVTMVRAGTLALLTVVIGATTVMAPVTGGISYFAAAPVAAMSGLEIAAIITASSIGLGLLIALFKGYEEVEFSNGKMVLRKRQSDSGNK